MKIRVLAVVFVLFLSADATAADLGELRRAVARDDRAAVERWLAAEAKAPSADPLAPLGSRRPSSELQEKAAAVVEQELFISVLAVAYLKDKDLEVKRQLIERLDATTTAKQGLTREVQQAAKAPMPKPFVFKQLFTAGVSKGGKLAEPSSEFSPGEPAIHVRFIYEGGVPGEELQSRWLFRGASGQQEFARNTVKLVKSADRGQFSFTPAEGTRWIEGIYRVEILGRGNLLAEIDFVVRGAQVTSAPRVAGLEPFSPPSAPVVEAPSRFPTTSSLKPGGQMPSGPITVLNAVLAKDVENGQAKDPVKEFSTARKRLVLWSQTQAPNGGALTARWYATDGGDRLLGEHTLAVPPGESRLAYWLEVADKNAKFNRGRFRVDLVSDNRVIQQIPFRIREAGFFEELGEVFEQFGKELEKAIKGEGK